MDTKQKYIRTRKYSAIIIFPDFIAHSQFKEFDPVSAGFCYVDEVRGIVKCFGESISLGLKSDPKDSIAATSQLFGVEAVFRLKEETQ